MAKPKPLEQEQIDKLSERVKKLQETMDSWRDAGIPQHTLVVLLSHYTKVPQRTIKLVMQGMDDLYGYYFTEGEEE